MNVGMSVDLGGWGRACAGAAFVTLKTERFRLARLLLGFYLFCYLGLAVHSGFFHDALGARMRTAKEFVTAGEGRSAAQNGFALARDWCSAAAFLGFSGLSAPSASPKPACANGPMPTRAKAHTSGRALCGSGSQPTTQPETKAPLVVSDRSNG